MNGQNYADTLVQLCRRMTSLKLFWLENNSVFRTSMKNAASKFLCIIFWLKNSFLPSFFHKMVDLSTKNG